MQPDASKLIEKIGLEIPLIGFYDAPVKDPFEPLVEPKAGKRVCTFAFFKQWLMGKTLHITEENFGCGGSGYWLCGIEARKRPDFIKFLADEEGLKHSHDLMNQWLDYNRPYKAEHPHLLIGPLNSGQYPYLKTITFFVNPDQLSMLLTGAQYFNAPSDPPPVIAPFGSGCSQLISLFRDLNIPQAIIGSTDIAMRQYLAPEIMAFTVTKPMYENLCKLDENSFLYKRFWKNLVKAREIKN